MPGVWYRFGSSRVQPRLGANSRSSVCREDVNDAVLLDVYSQMVKARRDRVTAAG